MHSFSMVLSSSSVIFLFILVPVCVESNAFMNRSCSSSALVAKLRVSGASLLPYLWFNSNNNSEPTRPKGELVRHIEESAKRCCPFITTSYSKLEIDSSDDIEVAIRKHRGNNIVLYFPVFAKRNEKEHFGRDFIPLYESPGISVLEIGRTGVIGIDSQTWETLFSAWTYIVELILAATIAGMVIWFLDCRKNEHFSGGFFSGAAAGIWWSFVTMTTVGYGDKTPKSLIGRIFAVIWMIGGTIFLSMFSARITAQLAMYNMGNNNHLVDTQVAVPLGMQNFLENELNLGAKYIEVDSEIILNKIKNPAATSHKILDNVKYAIVHDHVFLQIAFLKANQSVDMRIKQTIEHRLSLGMVVTGKKSMTMKSFYNCWCKEMIDNIAIHKAEMRSFFREARKLLKEEDKVLDDYKPVAFLAVANGFLFFLGCLWEIYKKIKKK